MIPGSLFFALSGPNFDGNKFARQALDLGAEYAVVSDQTLQGDRYLHVDDPLAALQDLARVHRNSLEIPLIAITGSNGKTTSKELMHRVLSARYRTFATQGNLNNHIGVPLSILAVTQEIEMAIIEMGANHVGEIAYLCTIARPTHGVVTNIGKAHLEGFGSLAGVKKGKAELYDALAQNNGAAFINVDLDFLAALSRHVESQVHYGFAPEPVYTARQMTFTPTEENGAIALKCVDQHGQIFVVSSQLFGAYNAQNMATAVAVGLHFNVPRDEIVGQIASYIPENNRSQRVSAGGLHWIMDAYNANPTSVALAIDSFTQLPGDKALILGEMRELGDDAATEHLRVAERVSQHSWSMVHLVGPLFKEAAERHNYQWHADVQALRTHLGVHSLSSGTSVLVKGSRSVRLEEILTLYT